MAFSDFSYPVAIKTFGLTARVVPHLFASIPPMPAQPALKEFLTLYEPLALMINTESARAQFMIAPVLGEIWSRGNGDISLYSGTNFIADPEAGLTGYCDFLLGRGSQQPFVTAPVLVVVEAKNESIPNGLGQCIAGMVGVQRFNARQGSTSEYTYGCVTRGDSWKFLRLTDHRLEVDLQEYNIRDVDRILGVLTSMLAVPTMAQPLAA